MKKRQVSSVYGSESPKLNGRNLRQRFFSSTLKIEKSNKCKRDHFFLLHENENMNANGTVLKNISIAIRVLM